jgi:hypothetical protein
MAAHDIQLAFSNNQQEVGDCDDTSGNMVTWKNWGSESHFLVRSDCYLTDAIVTATGGTVVRYAIYVNGKDTGIELGNAFLAATTMDRIKSPIGPFKAGSRVALEQI